MAVTRVFLSERELLDAIKREELDNTVRFVKQRRRVSASEEGLTLEGKRVRFQDEGLPSTAVNIPYDGTPFIVLNSEVYECQHGPQHSKEVKDVVGKTKKLNCQAVIRIRRVLKFPEFKINGNPTKSAKILMSCRLKSTFNADTNKQLMIYANISSKDDHQNHPIGEVAGFTQAVDSGIIAKIKQLARDGHRKVSSVKLLLRDFVREELAPEAIETNRRFFPTSSDIRNHIYQAVVGGSFQSLEDDQMNVAKLVEEMKNLHPHDKYFFRPASSNEDCVESLLLVMQTNFQQKMLLRYGSEIVLMDATYKTTRYELPMYNLCVPSNSGYIVVGSFYISKDTMSSVREALEVLRKWNAGWTPRYFMCDFDLREVGAVESTFKGAEVLLCNFHRDQAWQRWLTANKITEKETVMQQLRAIALTSETEEYEASVEIVRSSQLYKENAAFKNWFEKKWIANSKRWVYLFRKDLSLIVTTTNGIESQYKTLKHCYLKEFGTGKSLQNVVEIFLKKYFPDSERSYKRANAMAREDVRRHASSDFPQFLIGRPKPFIKHCMGRIPPKVPEINEVVDTGNDTFVVSSNEVTVSNSIPKCTCVDYRKMKWPCKHILAIHMKKGVSYTDYFSHPLFTLDESAFDVACPVNTDDTEISPAMVQEPSVVKTENSCRRDCLEQLKLIENGLYIISDVQLLESVNRQLEGVTKFVEANTVKVCGLTKGKKRKWRRTSIRRHAKKPKNQKKTKEATVSGNTMQPTSSVVVHETSTTEEELMRIWSNPPNDETVLQLGPYNITNRSLHFLKTTLSDEIMDAYLKLLTTGTNVLHISSVIATAIFEGRDNLSHFLTREQFDHYDYCIAAVNERGHHWVLIIIQPQERKLIYINPMGEIRAVCNNLLQFWCNFIAGQNRPLQEQRMAWSIETVDHSKQFDSVSCGVYVLRFAENFLSNATLKFNWTFGDIVQERKRMELWICCCSSLNELVTEAPIAVETMAAPGPRQQTDKETDIEAPIAVETMAAPGPRQQTDKETDIEAPIAVEKMASPAPRQQTDKETDIEAPIAVETMAAPGPRQQTDKETDIDSLTGSVLHRNQRKRYRKEKRHSFLYPKLKRKQNLFCVCHQRNDGRTYWQCDVCEDWFHPECIGFKEEDEPSQFICDDCKPSEKEKAKTACMDVGPGQDKISKKQKRHIARRHLLMSSLTKDTDNAEMQQWEKNMCVPAFALETTPPIVMQEDEDVYETCSTTQQPDVFRVEDIENALREGYSLVSGVASGRVKSQFHEDFMEIRNRKCTRGYGLLMFTSETYMAVEVWVRQTFLKDITKDMFAKWGTVRGAGEDLLTTLKESPSNAEIYIMNVIFKEVITRIYMILKKMSWKHAVSLCRSTEAESWLKAMKLVTSKNKRT